MRGLLLSMAVIGWCSPSMAQGARPRADFPPDIIVDRFIDVVRIAPKWFKVEQENEHVRVLRARLPGEVRVPTHDHRSGLLVAITDVHLRFRGVTDKARDLHIPAGETRWIDEEAHSEENLDLRPCEFIFVELKEKM